MNQELNYCCVCYENFDSNQTIKSNIPCKHDVCKKCINLIKKYNGQEEIKCPVCRKIIPDINGVPFKCRLFCGTNIKTVLNINFYEEMISRDINFKKDKNHRIIFYNRHSSTFRLFVQKERDVINHSESDLSILLDVKIYKNDSEEEIKRKYNEAYQKDIRFIIKIAEEDTFALMRWQINRCRTPYIMDEKICKITGRIRRCGHCKEVGHSKRNCHKYKYAKSLAMNGLL